MSITSYQTTRIGTAVQATVTSDLSGTIYYHWFLDGIYCGVTTANWRTFQLKAGEQARVEVLDTLDPEYDAEANAPAGYPARRLIWWVASLSGDVDSYRIEQRKGAGDWTAIAVVFAVPGGWSYSALSDRLDDLSEYTWRAVPVDRAGNDGTPITIGPEMVVRNPDAPLFAVVFNPATQRVTFSGA